MVHVVFAIWERWVGVVSDRLKGLEGGVLWREDLNLEALTTELELSSSIVVLVRDRGVGVHSPLDVLIGARDFILDEHLSASVQQSDAADNRLGRVVSGRKVGNPERSRIVTRREGKGVL